MRLYRCEARYQRFVESTLALCFAEIGRDRQRREDADPRVRALATIPEGMIDADAPGELLVSVAVPNAEPHQNGNGKHALPTHLHAFNPIRHL